MRSLWPAATDRTWNPIKNMITGQIILNGIYDPQLEIIIHVKEQHEGSLTFNPQTMQVLPNHPTPAPYPPRPFGPGQPVPPPNPVPAEQGNGYNNVTLGWSNEDGLHAVMEILYRLMPEAPAPPFGPLPSRP